MVSNKFLTEHEKPDKSEKSVGSNENRSVKEVVKVKRLSREFKSTFRETKARDDFDLRVSHFRINSNQTLE